MDASTTERMSNVLLETPMSDSDRLTAICMLTVAWVRLLTEERATESAQLLRVIHETQREMLARLDK